MPNIQVRVPEDLEEGLDALADLLHTSRSEIARNALDQGLQTLRLEYAFTRYLEGDFTLARAASFAGVNLHRMARYAAERGVAYRRYSVEEAERDVDVARSLLDDSDGPPPG